MAYEKRVVILKQIGRGFSSDGSELSGAVYAERLGTSLTLKVQAAGLAPLKAGRYALVFTTGERCYCLYLSDKAPLTICDAPSLKNGFSVLIAFVRGEAQPVAFGCCGVAPAEYHKLLFALSGKEEKRKKPFPPPRVAPTGPNQPNVPVIPLPAPEEEKEPPEQGAPFQDSAEQSGAIAKSNSSRLFPHDKDAAIKDKAAGGGKAEAGDKHIKTDDGASGAFLFPQGRLTYYKKVKEDFDRAFLQFPKDGRLKRLFPQSEWANTGDMLMGIIYKDGLPCYLCTAQEKSGDAPKETSGHGVFVSTPHSGDGFYIEFRSADTGGFVNIKEN